MKRRNFIKITGLTGVALSVNPFSLAQKPFQVGDIVEIDKGSAGYHDGILRDYPEHYLPHLPNDKSMGLKWIVESDTDDDNLSTSKYKIVDLKAIRKSIIDYAAILEKQLEYYIDGNGGRMSEDSHDDGCIYEYAELCTLCILIDDKKLWDSIYKSEAVQYHYGSNGEGNKGFGHGSYDYFVDEWDNIKYGEPAYSVGNKHYPATKPMIRRIS